MVNQTTLNKLWTVYELHHLNRGSEPIFDTNARGWGKSPALRRRKNRENSMVRVRPATSETLRIIAGKS